MSQTDKDYRKARAILLKAEKRIDGIVNNQLGAELYTKLAQEYIKIADNISWQTREGSAPLGALANGVTNASGTTTTDTEEEVDADSE